MKFETNLELNAFLPDLRTSLPAQAVSVSPKPQTSRLAELLEHRRGWLVFALAWILAGLVHVGPAVVRGLGQGDVAATRILSDFSSWILWGLFCPVIWSATRRYPPAGSGWLKRLPWHLAVGLAVALGYSVLERLKTGLIEGLSFEADALPLGIGYSLGVYFACVAVIGALTFREAHRDSELRSSRLQGQMALAQLQVLKMQLHPHFLFNTLNAISALMHRDVDAADGMIAQLSDLLRVSLDKDDRHEVPLSVELDFLERYLAIEKIRFRDRLKVEMTIEPRCLDAFVPKLILQPLVENAIRHGIAMRSAAGRVAIRAQSKGSRIELDVSDDGPGLPPGARFREGVGLANTRARLEQLYGEEHRIELTSAPIGGLQVHLEFPLADEPRVDA